MSHIAGGLPLFPVPRSYCRLCPTQIAISFPCHDGGDDDDHDYRHIFTFVLCTLSFVLYLVMMMIMKMMKMIIIILIPLSDQNCNILPSSCLHTILGHILQTPCNIIDRHFHSEETPIAIFKHSSFSPARLHRSQDVETPTSYQTRCKVVLSPSLSTCLKFNFNNNGVVWDLVLRLNCSNLFQAQNFLPVTKTFPEPTKLRKGIRSLGHKPKKTVKS